MNEKHKNAFGQICYAVDNNFAYKKDVFDAEPTKENRDRAFADIKVFNFVPTYDHWCLFCGKKDVSKQCSRCRHVYFCDQECQRKSWAIHRKHCGRNVFCRCATCGSDGNLSVACSDGCRVVWCSEACKSQMLDAHRDFDCANFKALFPK